MGLFDALRKKPVQQAEESRFALEHFDFTVPVTVIREARANSRIAIGKGGAIMRISRYFDATEQEAQIQRFRAWLIGQLERHPEKYSRFRLKMYHHGEVLQVNDRDYTLQFVREPGKTNVTGKLNPQNRIIVFYVPEKATEKQLGPAIESLLSRLIGAHFLPEITKRVHELNAAHFRKKINNVSLKYNHTNWGSCSSKNNINLSTRLLFAPQKVLDYVIIHELAHLIEMNHSPRFWALVAQVMPDYKAQEKWLKKHGSGMGY
ncbi:MAG: M48 family metallopeptidase [Saprospiraceae bacterium]|nr:M48 family metallopeptidase [Saprospiraceae bacterium]